MEAKYVLRLVGLSSCLKFVMFQLALHAAPERNGKQLPVEIGCSKSVGA
jgi:hypothetical protein